MSRTLFDHPVYRWLCRKEADLPYPSLGQSLASACRLMLAELRRDQRSGLALWSYVIGIAFEKPDPAPEPWPERERFDWPAYSRAGEVRP